MWSIYGYAGEKFIVWDGQGCEIWCLSEDKAYALRDRLNKENIYGKGILPDWIAEYQK